MSLYPSNESFLAATGGTGSGAFQVEIFVDNSKNLVVADNLKFFVLTNSADTTISIPDNSAQAFPIGAEMEFLRDSISGNVTFIAPGAAIVQSRDGLVKINTQYSAVSLKKIDTDEWRLIGDLV